MRCPYCLGDDDKVVDSRPAEEGSAVRRRRECLHCGRRFTTYERVEELPLVIVKRSGRREPFSPEKLRAGVAHAVVGRGIDTASVDALVAAIEDDFRGRGAVATSEALGVAVLEHLRQLDAVSYLRFASVYKGFEEPGDFAREVVDLEKATAPKPAHEPDS